jgi:hypothetical protein
MKILTKPSLILILSFAVGYIGAIFLPITTIHYQIIDRSQSETNGTIISTAIGFASAYDNHYGMEALPCALPRFAVPDSSYKVPYRVWQTVTKFFFLLTALYGLNYVRRRKMPLLQFFVLAATLMLAPVGIGAMLPTQIICSDNTFYQITSFTPYLPTIFVLLVGFLVVYRAVRLIDTLDIAESNRVSADALQS